MVLLYVCNWGHQAQLGLFTVYQGNWEYVGGSLAWVLLLQFCLLLLHLDVYSRFTFCCFVYSIAEQNTMLGTREKWCKYMLRVNQFALHTSRTNEIRVDKPIQFEGIFAQPVDLSCNQPIQQLCEQDPNLKFSVMPYTILSLQNHGRLPWRVSLVKAHACNSHWLFTYFIVHELVIIEKLVEYYHRNMKNKTWKWAVATSPARIR